VKQGYPGLAVHPAPFLCHPAEAFRAIAGEPWAFLLDSALNSSLGRYSFFGTRPFLTFVSKGNHIVIQSPQDAGLHAAVTLSGNPFEVLRGLLQRYSTPNLPHRLPFVGGAVGYFGYDLCHFLERLPRQAEDDLGFPDCALGFYDVVVAFDHVLGKGLVFSSGLPETEPRAAGKRARARIEELLSALDDAARPQEDAAQVAQGVRADADQRLESEGPAAFSANFARDEYLDAVCRAKEYIAAGDIYQVNLSQRFEVPIQAAPFTVYEVLRQASPAPFAAFLNFPDVAVASASPERFLRIGGRVVQTRPIKGTRPRGENPNEDEALARELLSSGKDLAENTMIVDLERNDLGRVCRYGSVKVTEFAALEAYSNVFHLVSTVEGELQPAVGPLECLTACFPGGSITGAPKIRAMQIIDELEPTCRSVYTGAIGYIGWDGNMDLNIVIRTLLMAKGRGRFQVGGGIVADSEPEAEYQETLDKAAGLFATLARPTGGEASDGLREKQALAGAAASVRQPR